MNNYVSIKGLLGNDPKVTSGKSSDFSILSIAQNYKSEDKEKTSWFDVFLFGDRLLKIEELKKGALVHIVGHLVPYKKTIDGKSYSLIRLVATQVIQIKKKVEPVHLVDIPSFEQEIEIQI